MKYAVDKIEENIVTLESLDTKESLKSEVIHSRAFFYYILHKIISKACRPGR